jgi:hypothetical protein
MAFSVENSSVSCRSGVLSTGQFSSSAMPARLHAALEKILDVEGRGRGDPAQARPHRHLALGR